MALPSNEDYLLDSRWILKSNRSNKAKKLTRLRAEVEQTEAELAELDVRIQEYEADKLARLTA